MSWVLCSQIDLITAILIKGEEDHKEDIVADRVTEDLLTVLTLW